MRLMRSASMVLSWVMGEITDNGGFSHAQHHTAPELPVLVLAAARWLCATAQTAHSVSPMLKARTLFLPIS